MDELVWTLTDISLEKREFRALIKVETVNCSGQPFLAAAFEVFQRYTRL